MRPCVYECMQFHIVHIVRSSIATMIMYYYIQNVHFCFVSLQSHAVTNSHIGWISCAKPNSALQHFSNTRLSLRDSDQCMATVQEWCTYGIWRYIMQLKFSCVMSTHQ